MSDFKEFLEELMSDPEVRKEHDALRPQFQMTQSLIRARQESGISQKELAAKTGIQQAHIRHIETGAGNPTVKTLAKLAKGIGKKLVINFV